MSGHGTRIDYRRGCRCAICTAASAQHQRERRARLRVEAEPVDPFASARSYDDGQRWPLGPLAERVGKHAAYTAARTTPKQIAAAGGLTDRQADRAAVRCGFHPVEVWPDWYTISDSISLAFAAIASEMRAAR